MSSKAGLSLDTRVNNMIKSDIPKVIHFCWFGGKPLPDLAKKCIASWEKYLPDYEIKRWDESNFDVNQIPYTSQAYSAKKYAFVSDYARFKILYEEGGLYFDTDVEVIRSMEDIINRGPFMGCENKYSAQLDASKLNVNPGLGIGTFPGHPFYRIILDLYSTLRFYNVDGSLNLKTVVQITTELLVRYGLSGTSHEQLVKGIYIYPWDYFCPMSPTLVLNLTKNSRTIHHFSASWESSPVLLRKRIKRLLGNKIVKIIQPIVEIVRKIICYSR